MQDHPLVFDQAHALSGRPRGIRCGSHLANRRRTGLVLDYGGSPADDRHIERRFLVLASVEDRHVDAAALDLHVEVRRDRPRLDALRVKSEITVTGAAAANSPAASVRSRCRMLRACALPPASLSVEREAATGC